MIKSIIISEGKFKNCTKCKIEKHILEFSSHYKSKDGFMSICKTCRSKYDKDKRIEKDGANIEKLNRIRKNKQLKKKKICSKCKIEKKLKFFHVKYYNKKKNYSNKCINCISNEKRWLTICPNINNNPVCCLQKAIRAKECLSCSNLIARKEMHKTLNNYYSKFNDQNIFQPRWNPLACQIIEDYGKLNGYNFQHAENGGEFFIKELIYWVDGYDKEQNIVIEYDEKMHFRRGKLKKKDIFRQNEIIKFLGCKFIRIKYDNSISIF